MKITDQAGPSSKSNSVVDIKKVRRCNIPYIILWIVYYAWVISFSTWWTASPSGHLFDASTRNMMHTVNLLTSAMFIFIIKKEWFVRTARTGAAIIIAGMCALFFVGQALPAYILAVIIAVCVGIVNISCLMPFVFVLNNAERMYAVVGSNILICIIGLFVEFTGKRSTHGIPELAATYILLLVGLSCVIFFKSSDIKEKNNSAPSTAEEMNWCIYLTLLFSCLFVILCKGAGKGLLNTAAKNSILPVFSFYYIGGLAGCVIYFLVFAYIKKSVHITWNIAFATLAMGLLCNAFSGNEPGLLVSFAVLLGTGSAIGMINMYYVLGVIGKKYNSMKYVRLSILLIGICGGIAGIAAGNFVDAMSTFSISVSTSLVSAGIMLLLLIISPLIAQSYYQEDWIKDSERAEISNGENSSFNGYKLTKRELEVCRLLLKGHTMRQISGMLSLAYPTINTYCTSAYRKLGINSRTELLLQFGEKK